MACGSTPTVEKDHFLCSKIYGDRSSSCCSNNDDHRGFDLKRFRKSMSESKELFQKDNNNIASGLGNKQKMKDGSASSRSGKSTTRRRSPSIPLVHPSPGRSGYQRVSLLERSLFPGIKPNVVLPGPSPTDQQSNTAQLTIFYAGVINVYDDVPVDQARAIMLLASQSSSSRPVIRDIRDITKADQMIKSSVPRSQTRSLCKIEEDLPIARRQSLRRFLDKRQDRITGKYPGKVSND